MRTLLKILAASASFATLLTAAGAQSGGGSLLIDTPASAPVGQSSTHRRHFPQKYAIGASGGNSLLSMSVARKNQLPVDGRIWQVFLPAQPRPARAAHARSKTGRLSTEL